ALLKTKGLLLVDGAFSPPMDPNPNLSYELFRDAMKGTGIILQPRCHLDWQDVVTRLRHPALKLAPVVPPPANGESADRNMRALDTLFSC
ncbi:hypothetical protein GX586_15980, partial [bacterium]|nr:hypothetical protein [bacterium]